MSVRERLQNVQRARAGAALRYAAHPRAPGGARPSPMSRSARHGRGSPEDRSMRVPLTFRTCTFSRCALSAPAFCRVRDGQDHARASARRASTERQRGFRLRRRGPRARDGDARRSGPCRATSSGSSVRFLKIPFSRSRPRATCDGSAPVKERPVDGHPSRDGLHQALRAERELRRARRATTKTAST